MLDKNVLSFYPFYETILEREGERDTAAVSRYISIHVILPREVGSFVTDCEWSDQKRKCTKTEKKLKKVMEKQKHFFHESLTKMLNQRNQKK